MVQSNLPQCIQMIRPGGNLYTHLGRYVHCHPHMSLSIPTTRMIAIAVVAGSGMSYFILPMFNHWPRFQYDEIQKLESGFMFFYFVRFKDEDGKNMAQSWLADSNTLKLPAFRQAQEHVLANGYAAYMEPVPGSESWDPFQLAGTFMADAPTTTDLYLFILVPEPYIVGDGVWVDIPSCHKGYYWSLDADGYQELSDEDCLELGLPEYTIDARLQGMNFQEEDYEIIRHFRSIHGEDSEMFKEFQSHITWHDGSLLVKNLQLDESWFTSHHHWHN
ncbi:hypothetical protein C8F01DRAFT_619115 [Mycena amicta]|nr:hypothetical protein C8F01DRAFT_619115 [Mycena amicta]